MRTYLLRSALTLILMLTVSLGYGATHPDAQDPVRIGIIGLDTSHSTSFTEIINNNEVPEAERFQVVAAYPKGNPNTEAGERIPRFTKEIQKMGVEIVNSIDALLDQVDVVMLETRDGHMHLEQALPVLKAGKRLYIDEPMGGSLAQVIALFRASEHYDVPVYSAGALRFNASAQNVADGSVGEVVGADTYAPARTQPDHPDLYWYGIHGVEILYTAMGPGCQTVTRTYTAGADKVVCKWDDGRIGTLRGIRDGNAGYGGTAFGTDGIGSLGPYDGYGGLVSSILQFFETGEPPVSNEVTIEIYAFMSAAERSKKLGGDPVTLSSVRADAEAEADKFKIK